MKEKPILFRSEMAKAILDGRKTQTRRVIDPDLAGQLEDGWTNNEQYIETDYTPMGGVKATRFCPYGGVGDRLWVRETWKTYKSLDHCKPSEIAAGALVQYMDGTTRNGEYPYGISDRWRPSIFMPRWASRITLEITGVRVERVQDISEHDAEAEGCVAIAFGDCVHSAKDGYCNLWDSINEKRGYGWDTNPWVWAIEFRRLL